MDCARKGEIEKAMDFLDNMISKGHEPNAVTYSSLKDGLCSKAEIENAIKF